MLAIPGIFRFFKTIPTCVFILSALARAQAPSSVQLTPSPNPARYGAEVTLTAAVTPGATGKVTFYDGPTILGIASVSGSQATVTTALLPAGSGSLYAYYQGDSNYLASRSAVVVQNVVANASLGLRERLPSPAAIFMRSSQWRISTGTAKQT